MAKVFDNNIGNSAVLTLANRVTNHYGVANHGYIGAEAEWKEVFDSRSGIHPDSPEQYQIFNLQTLLGNYLLPTEITGRKLAILGRMVWGAGGAQMSVDFDWKLGNQISVGGTFIRVEAAYAETYASPEQVRVTAMFTSGSRASRSQATRTFPQVRISGADPAEVVMFPIPPMAHALNIFADDPEFYEAGQATIRFVGGVSTDYSSVTTDLASFVTDGIPFLEALGSEDGVRFPEAAKFVEVSTSDLEGVYLITPCFTLNL